MMMPKAIEMQKNDVIKTPPKQALKTNKQNTQLYDRSSLRLEISTDHSLASLSQPTRHSAADATSIQSAQIRLFHSGLRHARVCHVSISARPPLGW
jgi:hypothetical protein